MIVQQLLEPKGNTEDTYITKYEFFQFKHPQKYIPESSYQLYPYYILVAPGHVYCWNEYI